jgi:hypothetical protein
MAAAAELMAEIIKIVGFWTIVGVGVAVVA